MPYQDEVKDTALTAPVKDKFIEPFANFHTELTINWIVLGKPHSAWDWVKHATDILVNPIGPILIIGEETIAIADLQKNYGSYRSPWGGGSGYDQICWMQETASSHLLIFWQEIGWLGFVLLNYAAQFNFDLNPEAEMTTYTLSCSVHKALLAVREISQKMLDRGEQLKGGSN